MVGMKKVPSRETGINRLEKPPPVKDNHDYLKDKDRAIFNTSRYGILVFDRSGSLMETNDVFERMVGLECQDILRSGPGDLLKRLVGESAAPDLMDSFTRMLSGADVPPFELERNGRFLLIVFPRPAPDHKVFVVFIEDITKHDIAGQKQAEVAVWKSEEQFRRLFLSMSEGFYLSEVIYDEKGEPCDYRYLDVNPAFEKIIGMSRNAIVGKRYRELVPEDTSDWLRTYFNVVRTGVPHTYSFYSREFEKYFETYSYQPETDRVTVFVRDVTARAKAEEALHENEEKYRTFIEQSSDGLFLVDEGGLLCEWNLSMERITGYLRSDVVGKPWIEVVLSFLTPESKARNLAEQIAAEFETARITGAIPGHARTGQKEIVTKDGRRIIVEQSYFVIPSEKGFRLGSVNRDITEIKTAERRLASEKERLAVTLRSIGEGVITTDVEGRIVICNKVAEDLTGFRNEEAVGRLLPEIFNIVDERTKRLRANPVEEVIRLRATVELSGRASLVSKNGQEITVAASVAPILDNENLIIGAVLVFRDMTEKLALDASMQRAQKLESLGILAGGIAHDFNNLLAGIFGFLYLIDHKVRESKYELVPQYIAETLTVFERARSLTRQLITFSKGGDPVRENVDLGPIIRKSAQFALSGSNVSVAFEIEEDLWNCDCDEAQIEQVIENIVINAKQSMPAGGKIELSAQNVNANEKIKPDDLRNIDYIRVTVRDQGTGMSKEIMSRIFDPFFSTKESGHGLGLATAFSIMQRHNGSIEVNSEPDKGSVFHIFIPASEQSDRRHADRMLVMHRGSGTVIVMDDEEFMLRVLGGMLEIMGYRTVKARNGEEAIALFSKAEEAGEQIRAVILDLTVPGGMGGIETLRAIRGIRPDAVVIASSGYSQDPVMAKPVDHGFTDKLIKPYGFSDLSALFERIFSSRT
jgi:PAS domain S-box-containing protein